MNSVTSHAELVKWIAQVWASQHVRQMLLSHGLLTQVDTQTIYTHQNQHMNHGALPPRSPYGAHLVITVSKINKYLESLMTSNVPNQYNF